ncbi:GMC family oxidoreductase N-terminal domain-containing protein [Sinomonas sp. ASV322]|uniref:GMC family oxidoreductase n=1 Tax=Sinomonas sp. ASV322 TaxID=3041920 RepID=UPI0027DE2250|nr:GMC family oxidoreductase N-terminal domain-containing protein [Sinomonas sp. ASV322]MDQ4500830.1 GMC family oxidoreductase N-terminal domain-containing protein [Sinomonas sp. ASV322]
MPQDADYIVVGAGSAGCVVARRLLDAGHRVVVLEAGGYDTNPIIADVAAAGALWGGPEDWAFVTTEQEGCLGRRLRLPRGKVMGGSHALNATIWVRGARQDYDTWAYLGCPGWSWDDVLPIFKAIENYDGGASELRGATGLLDVRKDFARSPLQADIMEAAQELGIKLNDDYNSGDVEGVSEMQLNVRDGKRFNTWHAYLKPVADSDRLTIITDAETHRLTVDGGRVTGVEYVADGETRVLEARETILCAGAIGTPAILLRSGIGPSDELREAGVEPVHELDGVGKNLHDHLLSPVIFTTTKKPVPAARVGAAETHLFWKSRPDLPVPDTQPIHFSLPMYFLDSMTGPENGFSLVAGIVRPASRGSVRLSGPNLDDELKIDLGALADQADVDSLVASVRQCRTLGRAQALAAWGQEEVYPGPEVGDSDEDLERYVRETAVTYHHQVGTCRMGLDELAVVDPRSLRVRGLEGVRVADASVMPIIPTGNTNAPSVLIGEKAAVAIASGR